MFAIRGPGPPKRNGAASLFAKTKFNAQVAKMQHGAMTHITTSHIGTTSVPPGDKIGTPVHHLCTCSRNGHRMYTFAVKGPPSRWLAATAGSFNWGCLRRRKGPPNRRRTRFSGAPSVHFGGAQKAQSEPMTDRQVVRETERGRGLPKVPSTPPGGHFGAEGGAQRTRARGPLPKVPSTPPGGHVGAGWGGQRGRVPEAREGITPPT